MSEYDPQAVLFAVFDRLRGQDFSLGIGELLVALRALEGGWGTDGPEALRTVTRLLWCHSPQQAEDFDEIYNAVLAALSVHLAEETGPRELPADRTPPPPTEPLVELPPAGSTSESPAPPTELAPQPVRTPSRLPPTEPGPELRLYWPLSRRSMVYAWRYLRRPIKDGPRDVLDVAATVEQTARQGFFLHPVYDRRQQNDAHLVLLIDQGGSMVPFHRFTRDLVETACDEEESRIRKG